MPATYEQPLGERFKKASKRAKKNAKRNAKRALSSLEKDKNPKQNISAIGEDAKPSQLGVRPDPLMTAVAAENRRDIALETKSSQYSPAAVSGSQREGDWQEMISMPTKANLKMLESVIPSSYYAVQEMKSSEYLQKDVAKNILATEKAMKLGVPSTGARREAAKSFDHRYSEKCSIAPEAQAPKSSSKEDFQPVALAAEFVRPPPCTMKPGLPQKNVTKNAVKRPEKVRKAPHPNCTKPQLWLADENMTMPMPDYPEPWEAPPSPPVEVSKRPVLTNTAKNFLLAQSPNSKITVHRIDDYGFTSLSAPIRAPDGCTIVPEYLVSTSTLCVMGFYMDSAEKIWRRYLCNEENRSMEDEYSLLFYTQRFIEDTYTDAIISERVTDSDILMGKWSLVADLRAAIRREARARDAANSWRPFIKITDLQHLKAVVMKKVSEKFRALDRLSYEIERRATKKPVSLTPMGDYLEMKARGMSARSNKPAEGFAQLGRMLEHH